MQKNKILSCQNLSIAFAQNGEEKEVLHNLSFDIYKSKILGIVGESGSGKSLSCLALMDLLPKNAIIKSGEINFYSEENKTSLLSLKKKDWTHWRGNKISMIFQEPMTSLNPLMKCGEQVAEILQIHLNKNKKQVFEEVISLFEKVKLPSPKETFDKYPHQLSGGQKQRVMIAMAIACKPDIIIADEPTTALDVSVQKDIVLLLKKLVDDKTALIFISHDLALVSEICDDILVMYKGECVEKNTKENIIHNPQNPYTKALLMCRPANNFNNEFLPTLENFLDKNKPWEAIPKTKSHEYTNKILTIKNINVNFEINHSKVFFQAVHNVSFELYEGEALGIVGESGSGKTTLANAIIGLQDIVSGEVFFEGERIDQVNDKKWRALRKDLQIIFQDPYSSLNPRMTVGKAIQEAIEINNPHIKTKEQRKNRTLELLSDVGLQANDYNKYPHEFSGGQRQRVVIARALAVEPKVIVCDESVSALDVSVQAQVLNLLKVLQLKYKLSYLFITHDLSIVRFLCSRILVMQKGEIVELQKSEDLFSNPQNAYTQRLLDAIPTIQ